MRSIIMTLIMLLVIVYVGLYVVLSVPAVQNKVKERVCMELSKLLGGTITIGNLTIAPFSEVMLNEVNLLSPEGEQCAAIDRIAAGIDFWTLISDRIIVFNYAEIIGLDVAVAQATKDSPLNIQFLIDALSPKDKNKPPTLFDLRIRNVVVRDSKASFIRSWLEETSDSGSKLANIVVSGLRLDLSIPELRNDLYTFDIRNIQFEVTPGIIVRNLSGKISYEKDPSGVKSDRLRIEDFNIGFPNSWLSVGDLDIGLTAEERIAVSASGKLTPSDFLSVFPKLEAFNTPWTIDLAASKQGNSLGISEFKLSNFDSASELSLKGEVGDCNRRDSLDIDIEVLKADLSPKLLTDVIGLMPKVNDKIRHAVNVAGRISLDFDGFLRSGSSGELKGKVATEGGSIALTASGTSLNSKRPNLTLHAIAEAVELGEFLSTDKVGKASLNIDVEATGYDRNADGHVHVTSDGCVLLGTLMKDIDVDLVKKNNELEMTLDVFSDGSYVSADGNAILSGEDTRFGMDIEISGFNPMAFGMKGKAKFTEISGRISVNTSGNNVDNLLGGLKVDDLHLKRADGRELKLSNLTVAVDAIESNSTESRGPMNRDVRLHCDWMDGNVSGRILPASVGKDLKALAGAILPSLLNGNPIQDAVSPVMNDFTFYFNIKGNSAPYAFFDVPVRPLTDIPIKGFINGPEGKAAVTASTPHLQQGKNKLIRDVEVKADVDAALGIAKMNAGLIYPAKKGEAELVADIYAIRDKVNVNMSINPTLDSSVKGGMSLAASFVRLPNPYKSNGELTIEVDILPSTITVNDKAWTMSNGRIDYSDKRISIRDFFLSHEAQYVKIDGVASESAEDQLKVKLNDIDLEYIFNILNINYVSFGGMATGEVVGSKLLAKVPEAATEYLRVKGLSYNGAVLGDGDLASDYDAANQKVGIYAVIRDPLTRQRRASVDGGIWVTRDSLSFGFDADKINVGIMKPFVSAFCSDLYGSASGTCQLYGTFSDIDMVGNLKADTLSMKLDFTNTWYHAGNDSVYLHKGMIDIPPLTLYDDNGNTAEFSGWLRHTFFHDPVFSFRLKDARSLLCYDTNAQINPLWYGTIYGSGHAQINGHPGLIDIDMNMTTEEGSKFYYIISDAEDIAQYSFLTFTDKRKERKKAATVDSVPEYLKKFRKESQELSGGSSNVVLSLKGTVTNEALVTLVMDPKAGDNITARGQGALQMDYNLASNDLRMIGTYILDEGNYNFTLQDIIIKNFNIRKGSLIKFNGDPMNANLDITATYRVNTNLTDLDESFANDKELNRTNVPVDAVLLVDGPMTNPDISFDIELPSLTSDVERKVKSIVSTNDMMSRQIIYLLAMNRFYTPEYTRGQQGSGSEWSSLASSTISSQLSNILSQMTDKLDVSPSFRSDKGDFTDMEFDLALSSRLLNNRLLINGNFGYRDKNTSNTQFIGDFDIEYLLSKNGNLRLKAYNHFNDQNYYLRSALTTQGVGVVFRRDFDRLFRKKKSVRAQESEENIPTDSIKPDKVSGTVKREDNN